MAQGARITLEFIDGGRGGRLVAEGAAGPGLLLRAHDDFARRDLAAFRKVRYWFSDYSDADHSAIGASEGRDVADVDDGLAIVNPDLVVAIVAPRDLEYGLARVWQVWVSGGPWRVRVVRSRDEAQRWLESELGEPVRLDGPASGESVVVEEGPGPD